METLFLFLFLTAIKRLCYANKNLLEKLMQFISTKINHTTMNPNCPWQLGFGCFVFFKNTYV